MLSCVSQKKPEPPKWRWCLVTRRATSFSPLLVLFLVCLFVSSIFSMFWKHFFSVSETQLPLPRAPCGCLPHPDLATSGCHPQPWGRVGVIRRRSAPPTPSLSPAASGSSLGTSGGRERNRQNGTETFPGAVPPGTTGSLGSLGAGGKVRVDPRVHSSSREALSSRSGAPGSGERVDVPGTRRHLWPVASGRAGGPRAPAPP